MARGTRVVTETTDGPGHLFVETSIELSDGLSLQASLGTSEGVARGVVVFAHGSGSSRHSGRNRYVANTLHKVGLGTLLLDLLTEAEDEEDRVTGRHRFDVEMLGDRVVGVIDWLCERGTAPIGLFGASTGAAAALIAAARREDEAEAVVSRGGRPDLAGPSLPLVKAPTLFIVGSLDTTVLQLNIEARSQMVAETALEVVPGAGHLFEEPGAIDAVARLAAKWFLRHLSGRVSGGTGPIRS
jgi:pimeloyl-ACP methyl ester carboxylesterase